MNNPSKSSPESPAKEQPGEVAAMVERLKQADRTQIIADGCVHAGPTLYGEAAALLEKLGQGWIPVSERLPELGERVLLLCVFGLETGRYADFVDIGERIQYPEGPGWKGYGPDSRMLSHWQPLPPPPERP